MVFLEENEERIISDSEDWADCDSIPFASSKKDECQFQGRESNVFLRKRSWLRDSKRELPMNEKSSNHQCQLEKDSRPALQENDTSSAPVPGLSWEVDLSASKASFRSCSRKLAKHSFLDRDPSVLDARLERETKVNRDIGLKPSTTDPQGKQAGETRKVTMCKRDDGATVITASHKHEKTRDEPVKVKGNDGWGNNFVRLNLKKFNSNLGRVKGARKFKRKFKSKWKTEPMRQVGDGANYMSGWERGSSLRCYKCGQMGHFSSVCTNDQTIDADSFSIDVLSSNDDEPTTNPQSSNMLDVPDETPSQKGPLYTWTTERCQDDISNLLESKFGYKAFRGNQEETILKVLQGESCLNIMPTGMGKSLCYQLPAFLLEGPVVVISPLIALMQDQCFAAPLELNAAVLWSGQSPGEARRILDDVKNGVIRLIFISPERVTNQHFLEAIRPWLPLQLLVIDEAHCISEWGHSFRPSYYRLGCVIRSELPCKSILALTATATVDTELCMREALGISAENTFRCTEMKPNIEICVERLNTSPTMTDKWQDIVKKLSVIISTSNRAIIYCSFRKDADDLTRALTVAGVRAKSYHSGTFTAERERILSSFVKGTLKVVVATTAFGMGVNIANVDLVVHASMPRSLEEYVQQIGRAGRSGQDSKCVCFVSQTDFLTLRSLAVNPYLNQKLINKVVDAAIGDSSRGQYQIIQLKDFSSDDIPEETIESIICYLENESSSLLTYFGKVPQKARVSFYARPPEEMMDFPLVNTIVQCTKPRSGVYHIDIAALCSKNGLPPAKNFEELATLSKKGLIGFETSKEVGFCVRIDGIVDDRCKDKVAASVLKWLRRANSISIEKLDTAYKALQATSLVETGSQGKTLQLILNCYFSVNDIHQVENTINSIISANNLQSDCVFPVKREGKEINNAVKAVQRKASQQGFEISAIEIANILHGVDRNKSLRNTMGLFWGSMKNYDYINVLTTAHNLFELK